MESEDGDEDEHEGSPQVSTYIGALSRMMRAAAVCNCFGPPPNGASAGETAYAYTEWILSVMNSMTPRIARKADELIRMRVDQNKMVRGAISDYLLADSAMLLAEAERVVNAEIQREQANNMAMQRAQFPAGGKNRYQATQVGDKQVIPTTTSEVPLKRKAENEVRAETGVRTGMKKIMRTGRKK